MPTTANRSSTVPDGINFLPNSGGTLRSILNGVKHDAHSFAKVHGLDPHEIEAAMRGEAPITVQTLEALLDHPPINIHPLLHPEDRVRMPIVDDTLDGIVVCTSEQTMGTRRQFKRGTQGIPYYDYADTAMSRTSPFRPEWILELFQHDGTNPELPDWAFNKGHLEFQMTYFIGPVNFHWISRNGKKHVRAMNTGDANYITPFVPHSFSTRKKGEGLILAVTYGGAISSEDFQRRIQSTTLEKFLSEVSSLEQPRGILPLNELGGVIAKRYGQAVETIEGGYPTKILIDGISHQPETRALEVRTPNSGMGLYVKRQSQRWGYNVGESPVSLSWGSHERTLNPDDSFFIKSGVPHSFGGDRGKLVVMEILPESGNPMGELSLIRRYAGEGGLARVHTENTRWF